jgi:peptide/nickel transport system permease protein
MFNYRNRTFRRFLDNQSFLIGICVIAVYLGMAGFGPGIAPHDPLAQDLGKALEEASLTNLLGRDELGRDLFSRLLYGARYTLGIALASVSIGLISGLILGSISGYYGGWVGDLIMRTMDVMLAFPGLLIAIAVISVLGRGLSNLILAIGLASIPVFTRLVHSAFISLRQEEYVSAARAIGAPDLRIMFRHVLPNALAPILVQTTYEMAGAILAASGLSFLGLGVQPPTPEWGVMLSRGRDYLRIAPHVVTLPGVFIAVAILGLNLIGDGLRDILDPKLINSK